VRIVAASLLGLATMMIVVVVGTVIASAALAGPDGSVTGPCLGLVGLGLGAFLRGGPASPATARE
jgi:hypothetical protein